MEKNCINRVLIALFFSFILVSTLFTSNVLSQSKNFENLKYKNLTISDDGEKITVDTDLEYAAGSNIDHLYEGTYRLGNPIQPQWPDVVEIRLISGPDDEKDCVRRVVKKVKVLEETPDYFYVKINPQDLKVPAKPKVGVWKIRLYIYDEGGLGKWDPLYKTFRVSESSLMDSLFAPIYVTMAPAKVLWVFEVTGWTSFELPAPIYYVLPLVVLVSLAVIIRIWGYSFKQALEIIKKGGKKKNAKK